jgi:hypothetical protein
MLLYKPHVNDHNILQQVGLIAINVVEQTNPPVTKTPPVTNYSTSGGAPKVQAMPNYPRPPPTPVVRM